MIITPFSVNLRGDLSQPYTQSRSTFLLRRETHGLPMRYRELVPGTYWTNRKRTGRALEVL